jgi:ferrous iron transport protein A
MTLDKLPIGQSAVIQTVGGEGALRCRLLDMGLIPGTRVEIIKVAPLGDPLELMVRGYSLSIRKEDARKIEVEAEAAV